MRGTVLAMFTIAILVILAGCTTQEGAAKGNKQQAEAKAVLKILNGIREYEISRAGRDKTPFVEAYKAQVAKFKEMDLAGCPEDFQTAMKKNIAGDEKWLALGQKYPKELPTIGAMKALLSTDLSRATSEIGKEMHQRVKEDEEVWKEMKKINERLGIEFDSTNAKWVLKGQQQ